MEILNETQNNETQNNKTQNNDMLSAEVLNAEQNSLKQTQPKQSLLTLKNPIFIANSTDPLNGKFVKEIRAQKIMKDTQFKQNRIKFDIVWQYMRDRGRQSVESIYKKYKGKLLHVVYSGDPVIYDFVYE